MKIVAGDGYIDEVKMLIQEYVQRLGRDLSFQNLEMELQDIAKKYTAPEGELLVALDQNEKVVGMVAYYRHSTIRCEMKRLYVLPSCRGKHIGEQLVAAIVDHARKAGYKEMVLDTITPLKAAIHLYKKQGFEECAPYYHNPMDDVVYMKQTL